MGLTSLSISRVIGVSNENAPRRADAPIPEASFCLQTCSVCIIRRILSGPVRSYAHRVKRRFPLHLYL